MQNPALLTAACIFLTISAYSQDSIRIKRTENPPRIDGIIEEDSWRDAFVVHDFWQREPVPGAEVTEKTEFLFLYDRDNLYIGARCFHEDIGDMYSKELARDVNLGYEDRIQIILDTYNDGRNGYWFQIGPRGSIGDALVSENGRGFNKAWDGIWDGKAVIHDRGWNAEIIIPFKTLSFKKGVDTWGIKLIRNIKLKSESSYWPQTTIDAERFQVSDAGKIKGLEGISQGIGLDLIPYLTTGYSKKLNSENGAVLDAGLDVFYQLTPSLKAALTINTDFAQTEVDSRQINLTRFSLFFPEKRDFFLDGANYFNFGINGDRQNPMGDMLIPFFSRRIGLDTEGNPVPVNYGGKFTGQAGRWNLGILHINDQNEWDNHGYSVARVSRNIGKQSYVGMIATNGNALGKAENSMAGIDLQLATSEFREDKNLVYNLYGLKSFTRDLKSKDLSFGTEINYPNDFLEFRFGYMQIGENFISGLGFVPRHNIRNFYGGIELGPRPQKFGILKINTGIDFYHISNLSTKELQSSELDIRIINVDFLSNDELELDWSFQKENLSSDFEIIDSVIIPADNYSFQQVRFGFETARRRELWLRSSAGFGSFYTGKRTDWSMEAGYQLLRSVFLGAVSVRTWVVLPDTDFITQILRFNLNFLFSPRITWYNFAQWDNQSENLGIQSRFQWIIKPGKEIFLVWNSPFIRDPLSRFDVVEYEGRFKLKYAIRF